MDIERIEPSQRWSEAVIHNNVLYYTAVPADEDLGGDIEVQMQSMLNAIDQMLEKNGTHKSRILDATIFLVHKEDLAGMNKAWDQWVVAGSAPVRCTVFAGLVVPDYRVEMKVIAAL